MSEKKPIISYESEPFKIDIVKEGKFFTIKCAQPLLMHLSSVLKELNSKKIKIYNNKILLNELSFKELDTRLLQANQDLYAEVVNPENIIKFSIFLEEKLTVKSYVKIKKQLQEKLIKSYDEINDYENFKEFKEFFTKAIKEDFKIIDDGEFPGTMLKFYKNDQLIKCVYIKDEKIEFIDSFAEKYKELQLSLVKEAIEKANKELKLEGKKQILLGDK